MSSDGADAMSEESMEKSALVPRLRFPEFDGTLSALPLAAVADFASEKISVEEITSEQYVSTENLLPDFGGMNPAVKLPSVSSVTSFRPNDILVSNIRPYLRKVWQANICGGASNDVLVVRPTERIGADYLAAILRSDLFIDYVMRGAKGVKMPRGEISMIQEFPVPCPNADEQQKIADCLSSLDELITAETQKLDALKTHKKGLMQQLFPREGETVPRLRFPEFREAGEWEERRLGEVGNVRMCKRILKEQTSPQGDIPFYKIGTFGSVPDAYISRELFENFRNTYPFPKNGAVLISAAGTIGRTVRYDGELAYFQDSNIVWLENDEALVADCFLLYLYQLVNWAPSVGAIQRLYNENILGTQVKFPRSITEQQKIADCLSSLDELITAQSQKIDVLKTHKKGLMQQLFPVLDEATA